MRGECGADVQQSDYLAERNITARQSMESSLKTWRLSRMKDSSVKILGVDGGDTGLNKEIWFKEEAIL